MRDCPAGRNLGFCFRFPDRFFPFLAFSQTTLTGTVSNENGETVPFVNVIEKGTSNGTTTDVDGNFSIEVDKVPVILVFSSF